jgi:hypothetical protein
MYRLQRKSYEQSADVPDVRDDRPVVRQLLAESPLGWLADMSWKGKVTSDDLAPNAAVTTLVSGGGPRFV